MTRRYLLIASTTAALPGVIVGARRLADVDPQAERTLVALDGDPASVDALRGLGEVRTGVDLGLTDDEIGLWAAAYGARGVQWAAFPHVLRAVGAPGERVLWLGEDVEIVEPPQALWRALESSELVAASAAPGLSPHGHQAPDAANGQPRALQPVTAVVEHDGELISRAVLGWQVGASGVDQVLAGWPVPREHPTHESIANDEVAQIWFNALPLQATARIVVDPGVVMSVAQLLDREVTEGPRIDGAPLCVLNLRGFDADRPHLLEGKGTVVTARVSERPALAPVLRRRAEALLAAGWHWVPRTEEAQTRWSEYPGGLPNSPLVQDLARAGMRAGEIRHSPFTPEGFEQFRAWATGKARVGGSIGVNRLLAAVHASRPDLHVAYPSLDGPDGLGFLGWAWVHGRVELSIPESFLPPKPAFLDAAPSTTPARTAPDLPGVNLAGYFTSELGLGESARQIASALETAGVSTTPVQGLLVPPTRQQAEFQPVGPQDAHHDVNIVVVNGDQMPAFARDVGDGFFQGRPTVGVWWWEVDPFPADEWRESLTWLDEIWVGTEFIRDLVEPHVDVPVWVFPVPVSVPRLEDPLPRSHFGFDDDETLFLYVWDYHSTEARKNPSGLVDAYRRAFPDGSPHKTRLVLKCINHENLPEADEKVRLAAAGRDDITFVDRFLSGREKNGLLELCDCYVSPHRSEGFGYTPAEAMLLGKPVVVTAYGGTTQYTDETVAQMVPWAPMRVGRGAAPYPPDGTWADPDLNALADALRWIVEEPAAAAAMAERGQQRVAEHHSLERCGRAMAARVEEIRRRGATNARTASQPDHPRTVNGRSTLKSAARTAARRLPASTELRRTWWRMQDRAVASRTADLRRRVDEIGGEVRSSDDLVRSLDERVRDEIGILTAELQRTQERFTEQLGHVSASGQRSEQRATALEERFAEHLQRHASEPWLPEEAGFSVEPHGSLGRALVARQNGRTGDQYADFLAMFRGPYERVLDLMAPYGEVLAGQGPLLDIGCGRGELLDVATAAGIEARGVDLDAELIRQARERGHSAEAGDGIDALARAADGSLGSVSAIHVIEHLDVDQLTRLFTEALRALRPGGILLTETINPHELSAASTFWVDPTHRGPVFPQVAVALALSVGFGEAAIYAPDGTGDWAVDRLSSTRYALLARAVA